MQPVWLTSKSQTAANARLDAALKYVGLGWSVVPLHWIDQGRCSCGAAGDCRTPGKHPHHFAPNGTHSASKDGATVRSWYEREPRLNIGIALGEASGVVVLDVDPRNGGDDTLQQIIQRYGPLPETASAITGGGGTHYVFRDVGQRIKSPGKGLDALSNGKLIVVEPSMHSSGKAYAWEGVADPLNGAPIADPPPWLLDPIAPRRGNLVGILVPAPAAVGYLDPARVADLRGALAALDADDYATWIAVGQALHSTDAPEAFELWDTWAQSSAKYKHGDCERKWPTFRSAGGLNVESIFAWAKDRGWKGDAALPPPEPIAVERIAKPKAVTFGNVPSHLLKLSGALGDLVDETNKTAPKCQPQFAVQTALAFGSVVMGRRYVTQLNNYTSLYFLAVGQAGCGKEYGRKVVERALEHCGMSQLLGPSGYTSDSAIFSELLDKPAHIAIIDEFGSMLKNSQAAGNFHKRQAIEQLKSAWGQLDGAMRPLARSTLGLPASRKSNTAQKIVYRPALSILGMSTPKSFYESLTEDAIEGGFLSRLLIVETNLGRMESNDTAAIFETPATVLDWCKATRQGRGNLAGVELGADLIPDALPVTIAPDALALFKAYERELIAAANTLEREGLAELQGRSREKALRLALILAGSDNPLEPGVQARHAEWAIDYVRFYTAQTIAAVREHMSTGKFSRWCGIVVAALTNNARKGALAAERGMTIKELCDVSRVLRDLSPREWVSVLDSLLARDLVARLPPSDGKRGRKRDAFVLVVDHEGG